ncbi:MAG: hypothetical protein HON65_01520 [Rhodospirillales bacterium]|nr:hypothetical protein [Rhodospirillales bacterium]
MKLVGNNNPITSYWSDLGAECEFRVLIDSKDATPLIMPRAGDSPVGASAKFKGGTGTLYLLPYLDFDKDSYAFEKDDSNFWTEEALQIGKRFISGIIEIEKNCRNNFKQTPPPTWLAENKTFSLPAETAISEKLLQLGTKIEALQTQKNSLLKNLDEEIVLKGLLYEKGFPLESAIIQALTLLGFNATNYHENDSEFDVVFDSPEGRLLGEAEGKDNRAINIDKLRQLEMNIHEDFSRDEIDEQAKGVLFGNAYRLLLPTERKDFFTAKCITAVSRSNTALVRTTDLYKVAQYLSAKSDKRFSKKCREAILNGVGLIIFPKMPIQKRKEPKVIIDSVD